MRFVHTSDWHLGRIFHERSLIEDQAHALQQLLTLLKDARPDALIVAGDLYDRALPPKEAVQLLDETLSEVVGGLGIPTLMISGNHDSGERVGFGSRLFDSRKLRMVGSLEAMLTPLRLTDETGAVDFYGLPYFDPPEVRVAASAATITDPAAALSWCVGRVLESRDPSTPAVAVAHAFISNASVSDSENRLSIGGSEQVPSELFQAFAYTALGHLHRPQDPAPRLRYSGSLLPYHFSESGNEKSFTLVELGADRVPRVETVPIHPLRKLRIIEGTFDELLALGQRAPSEDYLLARRLYDGPKVDVMGRLRASFPNLLCIEIQAQSGTDPQKNQALREAVRAARNPSELFKNFFKEIVGSEISLEDQVRIQSYFGGEP